MRPTAGAHLNSAVGLKYVPTFSATLQTPVLCCVCVRVRRVVIWGLFLYSKCASWLTYVLNVFQLNPRTLSSIFFTSFIYEIKEKSLQSA